MSPNDKKPFGEKKSFGKKPFGAKKFGDRGPRREGSGGFGGKRSFGDRGPRGESGGGRGPRREGGFDRGPRRDGKFDRGPRREGGFGGKRSFGDRGPRADGGGSRGPRIDADSEQPQPRRWEEGDSQRPFRKKPFGGGKGRFGDKPARHDNSRFRGMYNGPATREDRERRQFRSYRPDPRAEKDLGPDAAPVMPDVDGGDRPHLAENELRYHGKNACLALLKSRPDDIVRVYVLKELAEELNPLIEHCAKNRKAYHLVDAGDLERLTDSLHHQGVCVIARAKRFFKEEIFFRELGAHRTLVLYLDGVANPHNLGAIVRTAAHFGVKFVCVPKDEINKISPALYRTAEGGAEVVNLVRVEDTEKFLDRMRALGFQLYAFEAGEKTVPLFETRLNEKALFVFGAEVEGLSGLVKTIVETKVSVPGTGAVESLNVSVAAAVAMAEFERQGKTPRPVRIVKSKS